MVQFFVANIFGHYVTVLCSGALKEVDHWLEREAAATRAANEAAVLAALGLTSAFTALFSRHWGMKILGGVASAATFSMSARQSRDAQLQHIIGTDHRTASLLNLVPARDLIGLAAELLTAEGLSMQTLEPVIKVFTGAFREVLGTHLRFLERHLAQPISAAIEGNPDALISTYAQKTCEAPHPASRATLLWLEQMLPSVRKLEEHQYLSYPLPCILKVLGGSQGRVRGGTDGQDGFAKKGFGYLCMLCSFLTLTGIFGSHNDANLHPDSPSDIASVLTFGTFAFLTGSGFLWCRRRLSFRSRDKVDLHRRFRTLWSVDTWLRGQLDIVLGPGGAGLPGGKQIHTESEIEAPWVGAGTKWLALFAVGLGVLLWYADSRVNTGSPAKSLETAVLSLPSQSTGSSDETVPETRRAAGKSTPGTPPPAQVEAPQGATVLETAFTVVNVVNRDALNVHSRPAMNSTVTAKLPNGSTGIQITGPSIMNERTEWVPIRVGERAGWVTKKYLNPE